MKRALAGGLLMLVACSSPQPVPPSGGPTSGPTGQADVGDETPACGLVFKAEVASAIGAGVDDAQDMGGDSDEANWLSECMYWRQAYHDQAALDLTVSSGSSSAARFTEIASEPDVSPLAGVGDEALLRVSTVWGLDGPVSALFARTGATYLGLSLGITDVTADGSLVLPGDSAAQQRMLVDLANIAIRRLTGPPEPVAKTCALLAVADAASIVGQSLQSGEDVDEHDVLGPSCHYKNSDGEVVLLLSVNTVATANDHFETCKQNGLMLVGAGDEAIEGRGDCGALVVDFLPLQPVVLVRSGETIITVAQASPNNNAESPDPGVSIARKVLLQLGLDPGVTPAPTAYDVLAHACSLLSRDQVGSVIREPITDTEERSGICEFRSGAGGLYTPLFVGISVGADAVSQFPNYNNPNTVPLTGVGDEAYSETFPGDESYAATVRIYVLSGQTVLLLFMDASKQAADGAYLAPGTPAEQIQMLTQLAQLILPQLPQ